MITLTNSDVMPQRDRVYWNMHDLVFAHVINAVITHYYRSVGLGLANNTVHGLARQTRERVNDHSD
jgi:hypothetical protein